MPEARSTGIAPLAGRTIVEMADGADDPVAALAVAFAGRVAASLGARVVTVGEAEPFAGAAPLLPDGRSALAAFLGHGKEVSRQAPDGPAALLATGSDAAQGWTRGPAVAVHASRDGERHSELTILAATGLLDIFGEPGRPPLPMPGHQAAYSAGASAFTALVAALFGAGRGAPAARCEVAVIDVARWLNWKHYLAAWMGETGAGIGRPEDWIVVPCEDGHVALVFQDKDLPRLAGIVGDDSLAGPLFAARAERRRNVAAFHAIIGDWARGRSRDAIVASARGAMLPIGPVLSMTELFADRQLLARDFISLASGSPAYGQPRAPGVWFDAA